MSATALAVMSSAARAAARSRFAASASSVDRGLVVGVAEARLHEEPVELRLRQPVGAGLLDRVLRRDHHERLPTAWPTPSTVTLPSSMTSSSADCVFGEARLISSASTIVANTGPWWNSKSLVALVVDRHAGDVARQQVGRELDAAVRALHRVRDRLARATSCPVPGTSSSSRWPSESRHVSASFTVLRLPMMAPLDVARRACRKLRRTSRLVRW